MFSIKQTRLVLFLTIVISFLFSVIGLNWNSEKEREYKMQARLEVPEFAKVIVVEVPQIKKITKVTTNKIVTPEVTIEKITDYKMDEGKAIVFE